MEKKWLKKPWLYAVSAGICLAALVLCLILGGKSSPRSIDPSRYTGLYRQEDGSVLCELDVGRILHALYLPDLRESGSDIEDYPDIKALQSLELSLSYGENGNMDIQLSGDMDTLSEYGIRFSTLNYSLPIPPYTFRQGYSWPEEDYLSGERQQGYLKALLDENGRGYPLRGVLEEVQRLRDYGGKRCFDSFRCQKEQSCFLLYPQSSAKHNGYRVVYSIEEGNTLTDRSPGKRYLSIEVQGLYYDGEKGLVYAKSSYQIHKSLKEAEDLSSFKSSGGKATVLSGGTAVKKGEAFDQNGFVRFPGKGTSFPLANGLYWSPSYDLLSEEDVWALASYPDMSLIKLLRFVRKEIYARHGGTFQQDRERSFLEHYSACSWYSGTVPQEQTELTPAEQQNIQLLREIQSLLEK